MTILPMDLIVRSCPLCGSQDFSNIFVDANFDVRRLNHFSYASRKTPEFMHYRLVICPYCDLLYANPIPREDIIAKNYKEASYDSTEESRFAAATYAGFLPKIINRLPDRHGAIDIGTGDGAFLEHLLAQGFVGVVGVEPSLAPVAVAKDNIRPLIIVGAFRPDEYAPESFSLVTCFQTLEHINDPFTMCQSVFKMLKPGGGIFFVCHDRRALLNRIIGLKSPIFDIEHLQLFSKPSVHFLLEESGFIEMQTFSFINRYPLRYWLRLLPLPSDIKTLIISQLNRIGGGGIPLSLPVGNLAIIGYKPLSIR
jgi:SAM-dependent methyltransferase